MTNMIPTSPVAIIHLKKCCTRIIGLYGAYVGQVKVTFNKQSLFIRIFNFFKSIERQL